MPKAIWNGTVIAESNRYFTADLLAPSDTTGFCPWKGVEVVA